MSLALVFSSGHLARAQATTDQSTAPEKHLAENADSLSSLVGKLPDEVDSIALASGKYKPSQDLVFGASDVGDLSDLMFRATSHMFFAIDGMATAWPQDRKIKSVFVSWKRAVEFAPGSSPSFSGMQIIDAGDEKTADAIESAIKSKADAKVRDGNRLYSFEYPFGKKRLTYYYFRRNNFLIASTDDNTISSTFFPSSERRNENTLSECAKRIPKDWDGFCVVRRITTSTPTKPDLGWMIVQPSATTKGELIAQVQTETGEMKKLITNHLIAAFPAFRLSAENNNHIIVLSEKDGGKTRSDSATLLGLLLVSGYMIAP